MSKAGRYSDGVFMTWQEHAKGHARAARDLNPQAGMDRVLCGGEREAAWSREQKGEFVCRWGV